MNPWWYRTISGSTISNCISVYFVNPKEVQEQLAYRDCKSPDGIDLPTWITGVLF